MKTLTFTDEEFQALAGMLDAAVKAIGLRAIKDAASLLAKMEEAAKSDGQANN